MPAESPPQQLQQVMDEIAAHPRIQAAVRRRHVDRAETVDGEGAKRTGRLILEHRHAATHRPAHVDGGCDLVVQGLQVGRGTVHLLGIARHPAGGQRVPVPRRHIGDQGARP